MEHYFTNNTNLKSEIRIITYTYENYSFNFLSDNGVFSKNKIDYGSKLLVETLLKNRKTLVKNILDVGCGYGFIGITLAKILNVQATLVDVNKRAVHLAENNIKKNQVDAECFVSNIYENVKGLFDLIVTNPPIRAGKDVVLNILELAKDYLTENGELWFVIRKDQGAKSIEKSLLNLYEITCVEKSRGFYIFKAKKR